MAISIKKQNEKTIFINKIDYAKNNCMTIHQMSLFIVLSNMYIILARNIIGNKVIVHCESKGQKKKCILFNNFFQNELIPRVQIRQITHL